MAHNAHSPLDLQGLRARSHNPEICGSKFTGTPWTWKVVSMASMEFLWNMAHKGYFTYSCMFICNKNIPSSAQYLTMEKIFLTSKFGYLLFCIPTLKLKLKLHRQGFLFGENLLESDPKNIATISPKQENKN